VQELNSFSTAVMESAAALVMVTDGQGRIVRFNRACQQVSGYSLEAVQGKYIWDVPLIPADEIENVKAVDRKARGGRAPIEHENHWVTRSGAQRLIAWSTVAFPDRDGSGRNLVRTGKDITDQRLAETALESTGAALRQSQIQLRTLTSGLLRAQEEERLRISRELHDDISQKLTALTVEAETLARKTGQAGGVSQSGGGSQPGGVSQKELRALRDRLAAVSEDVRPAVASFVVGAPRPDARAEVLLRRLRPQGRHRGAVAGAQFAAHSPAGSRIEPVPSGAGGHE
jgi:PAS domain S-box-containing protein